MGNDAGLIDQVAAAGDVADEPVWELPLDRPLPQRSSTPTIADMTNMGGANAGSITAALFLEEFVDGDPWAHIDIAGTAQLPAPRTWRNKGAPASAPGCSRARAALPSRRAGADEREERRHDAPADGGRHRQAGSASGFLGRIERIGNKVPHPAIIFLGLIVIVDRAVGDPVRVRREGRPTEVAEPRHDRSPGVQRRRGTYSPSLDHRARGDQSPTTRSHTETIEVKSLLTADGIRFIFTTAVQNFNDFGVVGVILVAMIGVGVAEEAGPDRRADPQAGRRSRPPWSITFIIVLLGGISSVASDAGYLVLIPLGAAAFVSLGRHPLAGHRRGVRRR